MLGVMAFCYRKEIRVRITEDTRSSHPNRERAPLFDVAVGIPKDVVCNIVFQAKEYQLRSLVAEPKARRIREAGQSAFGIENARAEPPLLIDLLKEATVVVIEFSARKRECCLHQRQHTKAANVRNGSEADVRCIHAIIFVSVAEHANAARNFRGRGRLYDVIIVGTGYAGLSAALPLAGARRRVLLLDDGRPRNRFAHSSHGIIGHDGADPAAIRTAALQQLSVYPTVERHEGTAVEARRGDGGFTLRLEDGREVSGRRLILASGVADRLPEIGGAEERWGITVLHCPYCHGWEVRDRPLGVLATSAGSANFAALLPDWGPTTYFTQGKFDPDPEQASLLELRGVTVEPTPIETLLGSPPALAGVRLADGRELPLEAMFAPSRWSFASPLAGQLGCAIEEAPNGPYVLVDENRETSVPGVYAAGDMARAVHHAAFAAADGAAAGTSAHRSLAWER